MKFKLILAFLLLSTAAYAQFPRPPGIPDISGWDIPGDFDASLRVPHSIYSIHFKNKSSETIWVSYRARDSSGVWWPWGWYKFRPGEGGYCGTSRNRYLLVYAESQRHVWRGDGRYRQLFKGKARDYKLVDMGQFAKKFTYIFR